MFKRKTTEFNTCNLENSTIYFPTSEPWTWTASASLISAHKAHRHSTIQSNLILTNPNPPLGHPQKFKNSYKPTYQQTQTSQRQNDTYFPSYTHTEQNPGNPNEPNMRPANKYLHNKNTLPPPPQISPGSFSPRVDPFSFNIQDSHNTISFT